MDLRIVWMSSTPDKKMSVPDCHVFKTLWKQEKLQLDDLSSHIRKLRSRHNKLVRPGFK
jgi:predicted transcriptional regulator